MRNLSGLFCVALIWASLGTSAPSQDKAGSGTETTSTQDGRRLLRRLRSRLLTSISQRLSLKISVMSLLLATKPFQRVAES